MSDCQGVLDVVAAAIVDHQGRFLMAQKKSSGSQPLHWEFPGGKVEAGESERQALQREILEELGVAIEVLNPLTEVRGEVNKTAIRLSVWNCKKKGDEVIVLSEHQQVKWLYPDEMIYLLTGPLDRQVVNFLVSGQNST